MVIVRQIKPREWELLRTLRLAALADAPHAFSETLEQARQFPDSTWQERAGGKVSFCALALKGKTPLGMAVGLPDENHAHIAYLVSMWVDPAHRGTRVAPDLVESVTEWARGTGATELLAGVTSENDQAQAFYRKIGFDVYTPESLSHRAITGCKVILAKGL